MSTIAIRFHGLDPLEGLQLTGHPARLICRDLACGLLGAEDHGADRVSGRLTRAGTYSLVDVTLRPMPPSNFLTSFDTSWLDRDSQRYYLADRSHASIAIHL